jgi:hypothetical protein
MEYCVAAWCLIHQPLSSLIMIIFFMYTEYAQLQDKMSL